MKNQKTQKTAGEDPLSSPVCSQMEGLDQRLEPWMKKDYQQMEKAGLWGPLKRYRAFRGEASRMMSALRHENRKLRKRLASVSPEAQWVVIRSVMDGDPEKVKRAVQRWEKKISANDQGEARPHE